MKNVSAHKKRILIMAGGTGGHVFPALAVARELQARGSEVQWLGTRRGIEAEVIPKAGIDISYINVAGLRGKGMVGWLLAPIKLMYALMQAISIVSRIKPDAVLGLGGFATGPGGVAAWLLRRRLLIHEQNSVAGLTNRLLAPLAKIVMEAFPNSISRGKAIHTGNPVREDIAALFAQAPAHQLHEPLHLLVVGGSLGARALNELVPKAMSRLPQNERPLIWHQTGKKHIAEAEKFYADWKVEARVVPFIDDMAQAYLWADAVICRSGAMTVAELAIVGLPSILVPFPHAVDDHQTTNAEYLSRQNAALLIQQRDMNDEKLMTMWKSLNAAALHQMRSAAIKLAMPQATKMVADKCMEATNA